MTASDWCLVVLIAFVVNRSCTALDDWAEGRDG